MEYDSEKWEKHGNHLLNKKLLEEQSVSEEQKKHIIRIYDIIDKLYKKSEKILDSDKTQEEKKEILKNISVRIENLEYQLQSLWGFPLSEKFHKYNLNIPGCTCPVLDNLDNYGYERIYNCECLVHWWKCENKEDN